MNNFNKWLSRTWIIAVYAMIQFSIGTGLLIWFSVCKYDISWYPVLVGFCGGILTAYVALEKVLDRERVKNEGG